MSTSSSPSLRGPRPVFASDLLAQRRSPVSATRTSASPSPGASPGGVYSMMDLSAKLGELPTIHLPEFHLPDLHRLKQQLHKHTPSFSLKSLQHTFIPSTFSSSSSSSSPTLPTPPLPSPSAPPTSSATAGLGLVAAKSRLSFAAIRRSSSSASAPTPSPTKTSSPQTSTPHPLRPAPLTQLANIQPEISSKDASGETSPRNTMASPGAVASSPISIPTVSQTQGAQRSAHATEPAPNALAAASSELEPKSRAQSMATAKSPVGHLFLQIIEARNLTLAHGPGQSRPFCLVEYDQNELMTPPSQLPATGSKDVFARAMASSSPKWRYDVEFDVVRPNQQISITIYDSIEEDHNNNNNHHHDLSLVLQDPPLKRFLGQVKLHPSEVHNRMIDSWFRLQGRGTGEEDEDPHAGQQVTGEIRVAIKYQVIESRSLSTSDFDILRVLGLGSFGKVYQVRKRDTGRIYAMKVLDKKQVIEQKQVEHTIAERNVLIQALPSPFIVGLKFSFQTQTKLYFVQDFMNGGDLFFHMQNEDRFSEPRARFYIAELVLALEHLHACHVVYRDLKPENILLSSEGHLVLADFGLCKQNVTEEARTHTFCGTTEYLAPEIVRGNGYGKAVDWWSLGVLLYEMLIGTSPFADSRTEGVYHKILHQPVIFPSRQVLKESGAGRGRGNHRNSKNLTGSMNAVGISAEAQDLIQRLLDKDPKTRLGSGSGLGSGPAAVKAHPFFRGIDFRRLETRDITPPFQPHVGVMGDLDVSNFDAHYTDQKASISSLNVPSNNYTGEKRSRKAQRYEVDEGANAASSSTLTIPSSTASATGLNSDGPHGFMAQQQQRAANMYRQQQQQQQRRLGGDSVSRLDSSSGNGGWMYGMSPGSLRRRRSDSSWSSVRTLSTESIFSTHEGSSPSSQKRSTSPLMQRGIASHRGQRGAGPGGVSSVQSALLSQSPDPRMHRLHVQQVLQAQQSGQGQEYFKGFTFEGESILSAMKRQDDERQRVQRQQQRQVPDIDHGEGDNDDSVYDYDDDDDGFSGGSRFLGRTGQSTSSSTTQPTRLFSGEPGSVDSIFGSM